jgi:cytochrome c peroxidase
MSAVRFAAGLAAVTAATAVWAAPLPTPQQAPPENPYSEAKRVLGKALFWDEQLSSDDTVSCGTCHLPARGGADARRARHPGADGIFNTPDDVFGSPGVVRRDADGRFVPHANFGLDPQVTGRAAPSALTGALSDTLFWDGRATSRFVDPQTAEVAIAAGGALESQAVGPPLSSVEMGHEGRTWDDVTAKLATAAPLALATSIPADIANVLSPETRYPDLFAAAFGDGAITARRIAFAIATYERTLVPDQTPWDRHTAGQPNALNAAQVRGLGAFHASLCDTCHTPPAFTNGEFRAIGVRPPSEDAGRKGVTGSDADRGKFKVPSLRGLGGRVSFMHGGQFTTITDVLRFYARAPGTTQFTDNIDPVMQQINLPPNAAGDIQALLTGGLDDQRATAGVFPFDRPSLYSERRDHGPSIAGSGRPGAAGAVPKMVAPMPPYLGNAGFRLGVGDALGGAQAWLAVSSAAPVGAELDATNLLGPVVLGGSGARGPRHNGVADPRRCVAERRGRVVPVARERRVGRGRRRAVARRVGHALRR